MDTAMLQSISAFGFAEMAAEKLVNRPAAFTTESDAAEEDAPDAAHDPESAVLSVEASEQAWRPPTDSACKLAAVRALQQMIPYSFMEHVLTNNHCLRKTPEDPPKSLSYKTVVTDLKSPIDWAYTLDIVETVGCFILDPPNGLVGNKAKGWEDKAWSLQDVVSLVVSIASHFQQRFSVLLYTTFSQQEVQKSLALYNSISLSVSKVELHKDTTALGRSGAGSATSSHLEQQVLVIYPSGATLNTSPYRTLDPVRYFAPPTGESNDVLTDGGGIFRNSSNEVVNVTQKQLLPLEFLIRLAHQGGCVVDLCCGSGSGMIAALRMGYNVVGMDISEAQVAGAQERVQRFLQQEKSDIERQASLVLPRRKPTPDDFEASPPERKHKDKKEKKDKKDKNSSEKRDKSKKRASEGGDSSKHKKQKQPSSSAE